MKDSKDHLDIDLEFLDKKEPVRVAPKPEAKAPKTGDPNWRYYDPKNANPQKGKKYNWKKIIIIGAVILFVVLVGSSDNQASSPSGGTYVPTAQPSGSGNVIVGQYSCPSYAATQADSIQPSDSVKLQLDREQTNLQARSNRLDIQKNQLDSTYVDETDQSSIDDYNSRVNSYNYGINSYKSDASALSNRIDAYNAQVERYNSYLASNCTKRY